MPGDVGVYHQNEYIGIWRLVFFFLFFVFYFSFLSYSILFYLSTLFSSYAFFARRWYASYLFFLHSSDGSYPPDPEIYKYRDRDSVVWRPSYRHSQANEGCVEKARERESYSIYSMWEKRSVYIYIFIYIYALCVYICVCSSGSTLCLCV